MCFLYSKVLNTCNVKLKKHHILSYNACKMQVVSLAHHIRDCPDPNSTPSIIMYFQCEKKGEGFPVGGTSRKRCPSGIFGEKMPCLHTQCIKDRTPM